MPIGYSNLLSQLLQVSSDSLASFSIMPIYILPTFTITKLPLLLELLQKDVK